MEKFCLSGKTRDLLRRLGESSLVQSITSYLYRQRYPHNIGKVIIVSIWLHNSFNKNNSLLFLKNRPKY